MSEPIRILHVFGRMERGGAELRTLDLMRYADRTQFKMDFCALSGQAGSLDDQIAQLGGVVHYCDIQRQAFAARFLQLLRSQQYDIVHSHVFVTSGLILQLARFAHVGGRIAHFRSSQSSLRLSLVRRWRERSLRTLLDWNATRILGVSAATLDIAWGKNWHDDRRFQVVYNGFAADCSKTADRTGVRQEFGIPENAWLIIHVGSLRPPKNHEKLIGVFAKLAQSNDNARLLIVGEGTLRRQIEAKIRSLGLEQRITMAGERDDVLRLFSGADLMIFPSLWEGLPGSVLECLASGVPVLTSDIPVMREVSQYLGALHIHSGSSDDDAWAKHAVAIAGSDPGDLLQQWRQSPFTMHRCVDTMSAIWQEVRDERQ